MSSTNAKEDYLNYLDIIYPEAKSRVLSLTFRYTDFDGYWDAMEQLRQTSYRSMYPFFPAVRYHLQEGTSEKQRIDVPYETEKAEE